MILLDTDHLSELQRRDSPRGTKLRERLETGGDGVPVATTIVSIEEQLRGRLAVINESTSGKQQVLPPRLSAGAESRCSRLAFMTMRDHDQALAQAFDAQAPKFEVAPVQSDPVALERLARAVELPAGSLILDAGCGPGLVSAALLAAGFRVVGVDLSRQMIERAQKRCAPHGENASFLQTSVYENSLDSLAPFDAALSRYVLHHVEDPARFLARQIELLRPGGILIVNDHITDPDRNVAAHHAALEIARDTTHTRNLTGGELVDLFASAGLSEICYFEESFTLDFDEWFDRGTPMDTKMNVRERLRAGPTIRSFRPRVMNDGSIRIDGLRALVRGVKTHSTYTSGGHE